MATGQKRLFPAARIDWQPARNQTNKVCMKNQRDRLFKVALICIGLFCVLVGAFTIYSGVPVLSKGRSGDIIASLLATLFPIAIALKMYGSIFILMGGVCFYFVWLKPESQNKK
ncbi:MAG: hypothetical protein ING64_16445 [Rhodocyclaceae bacterium]|nr:hypothetical protein [Rhodocyclaceae bacterium]